MERRTHPSSSKAGSVSRNADVPGGCTFRCSGCLPMRPGLIRSKFGEVGFSANTCNPITFSARRTSNALSTSSSLITTRLPNRSIGPIPWRSLNRNSEIIYDSLYLVLLDNFEQVVPAAPLLAELLFLYQAQGD